jgi:predicted dehydrogenase
VSPTTPRTTSLTRRPVRIGLLGAARIAPPAVIEPARTIDDVTVTAVAARDPQRAAAFAAEHGVPHVVDTYEQLVASDLVDAVYIGLPPSGHAPWTIAALDAGKHVLCEKPFACTSAEAEAMVDAADRAGLVLCEAFHWRFHPLAARLRELLDDGVIGETRAIEATFDAPIPDLADLRHDPALGGGAMMDLGCYALQWARFAARGEPQVVSVEVEEGVPGIDLSMAVELEFPGDVSARLTTSMAPDVEVRAVLRVVGVDGSITAHNPLAPHLGHALVVETGTGRTKETVDGDTTYAHQLRAFVGAVLDGGPLPTGGVDAVATMRVIEDCYTAAGLPARGTPAAN